MPAAEPNARDTKLIQYLNEAYGKERELETALQAHIAMTTRAPYKKRLQEHLKETKAHARGLQKRIKQLGGKAEEISNVPGPEVAGQAAGKVTAAAKKAVSASKGPMHMLRGTGEAEKMLKNAKTEYFNEHEEIATYNAIESLATQVGDKDTAKLAKEHRRQEERMASFLERLIPQLTRAVAQEEIPAAERKPAGRGRSRSASRGRSTGSSGARKSSAARKSSGARKAGAGSRSSSSSRSRSSGSRSRSS